MYEFISFSSWAYGLFEGMSTWSYSLLPLSLLPSIHHTMLSIEYALSVEYVLSRCPLLDQSDSE